MSGDLGRCHLCGLVDVLVDVVVPAHLSHTGQSRQARVPVDACIAEQVRDLNNKGRLTANCCCGHGSGEGSIILHDGTELPAGPSR